MRVRDGENLFRLVILPCGLFLTGIALLLVLELVVAGSSGFPFDDSWIFAQYARNLANGHGFCFNIGEPSSGFTSFLWLLHCTVAYKLTGSFVLPMKLMGVLFGVGSVVMSHLVVETLTGDKRKAQMASYLTAISPPLVANSLAGMEGSLYAFTALTGIWLHLRWRMTPSFCWLWEGVWWGIAVLTRPENLLLWGITIADKLWRNRRSWHSALGWMALQVVPLAALASLWIAVNLNTTGTPFPCTYLAKVLPVRKVFYGHWGIPLGIIVALMQGLTTWLICLTVLFPSVVALLAWKLFTQIRQQDIAKSFLNCWLFGAATLMTASQVVQFPMGSWTVWGFWGRYLLPAYLIAGMALMMGLPSFRWVLVIAILGCVPSYINIVSEYAQSVEVMQRIYIPFGKWLSRHTPQNAIIATHDIGAIGFFSHRHIFDTQGLIHADVAKRLPELWNDSEMLRELRRRNVSYLAVSDSWSLVNTHPELFELIKAEPGWNLDSKRQFCIFRIRLGASK